jgi:hypothetical protein
MEQAYSEGMPMSSGEIVGNLVLIAFGGALGGLSRTGFDDLALRGNRSRLGEEIWRWVSNAPGIGLCFPRPDSWEPAC